jgi:hypothetical protein
MSKLRDAAGFMLLLGASVGAQDAAPARPIAETAERMARELWPTDVSSSIDDQGRPRFRATATVNEFGLPVPWQDVDANRAPFKPRGGNLHHHQFLAQVTPEEFRSSVLYPAGITVDPGEMFNGLKSAWRSWQEKRVRERIAKEMEELRRVTGSPN